MGHTHTHTHTQRERERETSCHAAVAASPAATRPTRPSGSATQSHRSRCFPHSTAAQPHAAAARRCQACSPRRVTSLLYKEMSWWEQCATHARPRACTHAPAPQRTQSRSPRILAFGSGARGHRCQPRRSRALLHHAFQHMPCHSVGYPNSRTDRCEREPLLCRQQFQAHSSSDHTPANPLALVLVMP